VVVHLLLVDHFMYPQFGTWLAVEGNYTGESHPGKPCRENRDT
jgi:hypothetical protein